MINRHDLVRRVAKHLDYPRDTVEEIIIAILREIEDAARRGDDVNFAGFGKFTTDIRGARRAANPANVSEHIMVPAVRVPKFRPGRRLKAAARENKPR